MKYRRIGEIGTYIRRSNDTTFKLLEHSHRNFDSNIDANDAYVRASLFWGSADFAPAFITPSRTHSFLSLISRRWSNFGHSVGAHIDYLDRQTRTCHTMNCVSGWTVTKMCQKRSARNVWNALFTTMLHVFVNTNILIDQYIRLWWFQTHKNPAFRISISWRDVAEAEAGDEDDAGSTNQSIPWILLSIVIAGEYTLNVFACAPLNRWTGLSRCNHLSLLCSCEHEGDSMMQCCVYVCRGVVGRVNGAHVESGHLRARVEIFKTASDNRETAFFTQSSPAPAATLTCGCAGGDMDQRREIGGGERGIVSSAKRLVEGWGMIRTRGDRYLQRDALENAETVDGRLGRMARGHVTAVHEVAAQGGNGMQWRIIRGRWTRISSGEETCLFGTWSTTWGYRVNGCAQSTTDCLVARCTGGQFLNWLKPLYFCMN